MSRSPDSEYDLFRTLRSIPNLFQSILLWSIHLEGDGSNRPRSTFVSRKHRQEAPITSREQAMCNGDLSKEESRRIEDLKLMEELNRLQNENKKLAAEIQITAKKLQVETFKLEAEVLQLTRPMRTPQFYFSIFTTLFSALAAIAAVIAIAVQGNLAKMELIQKQQQLDAEKNAFDARIQKEQTDFKNTITETLNNVDAAAKAKLKAA